MTQNLATQYPSETVCPCCNGTGWTVMQPGYESWRRPGWRCYNPDTDQMVRLNCGGQTMSMRSTGLVRVNPETGNGCIHSYRGSSGGRCWTTYTCVHCNDRYDIDSSD